MECQGQSAQNVKKVLPKYPQQGMSVDGLHDCKFAVMSNFPLSLLRDLLDVKNSSREARP